MEIREKMLWQIANTVMVNHQFIDTPEFCAEQAEASLLLFKVSQRLDIDIYRDFALRCFERCVSQLPKISQKVTAAGCGPSWPDFKCKDGHQGHGMRYFMTWTRE